MQVSKFLLNVCATAVCAGIVSVHAQDNPAQAAARAALMFTSGPAHGEAIGSYRGEPLYHASLDAAEYRTLLSANGFEVMAHMVEDPNCGHHTIWLAQLR